MDVWGFTAIWHSISFRGRSVGLTQHDVRRVLDVGNNQKPLRRRRVRIFVCEYLKRSDRLNDTCSIRIRARGRVQRVVSSVSRHAIWGCQFLRSGARPTMHGAECMSPLVCTLVCLRIRLLGGTCRQNGFVDNVARVHGCSVSD